MTLQDLVENLEDVLRIPNFGQGQHPDGPPAKGFTVGKGKLMYWWITPMARSNRYRLIQEGYETKVVSIRYGVPYDAQVTIHY